MFELLGLMLCSAGVVFWLAPGSPAPLPTPARQQPVNSGSAPGSPAPLPRAAEQQPVNRGSRSPSPRGLSIGADARAWPGFTLIPEAGSAKVNLIDRAGRVVHSWAVDAQRARLLPNCSLLVLHGTKWGAKREPWRELRSVLREYDWEGRTTWEYRHDSPAHHDLQRLPDGGTIFLSRTLVPSALTQQSPELKATRVRTDLVREVSPSGTVLWEWSYHESFPLTHCGREDCRQLQAEEPDSLVDWTHSNTVSPIPENKWFDAGDQRFRPGNILLLPRNWSTIYLLDRIANKIAWEYGGEYRGGLSGGHEAQMIAKGLPGAGNILVFDNGRRRAVAESYALEIDPSANKVVWSYSAGPKFFSHAAGSLQRLPNGNTLISEDVPGRTFEVTSAGEIVWEYHSGIRTCRAQRYPLDYCGRFAELERTG